MRRVWLGLALLSASWLASLGTYHDPRWIVWAVLVGVGTCFLFDFPLRKPKRSDLIVAAALLIAPLLLVPWPYRAAVLLLFVGLLISAAPIRRHWPGRIGAAALTAGSVLAVQALALLAYEAFTARSHELPWRLPQILHGAAHLLGIQAALDGTSLALHSIRRVHQLGATWELLLDPVTFAFLTGGVALVCLRVPTLNARGKSTRQLLSSVSILIVSVALWLPVRAALLIAIFMHRALRTDYNTPLVLMNQFWSLWVHLALLIGPVLLALRFIRMPPPVVAGSIQTPHAVWSRRMVPTALALIGSLVLTLSLVWEPSGPAKQGRIWVDEHRSTWERTDRPYDPNWYGQESGYNYACIYDYCSRFYDMGRLHTPIDADTLTECDVLIVKVPTARYNSAEIDQIERFVADGGGLLLIGEHTNVFNTGTYLNDIAARFGFRFRYDCLFDIDTTFNQLYHRPAVPHPIVQHLPPLDFAVACSIDPGMNAGCAAIAARGLRGLPADYHASNYYPQVTDRAEARYGAFTQLWTTPYGAGRVAAFGDSTIFSNFSTFEPGKAELMLGMLQWLNHRNPSSDSRPLLVALGGLLLFGALVAARGQSGGWFILLSAGLLGVSAAGAIANGIHRAAMPVPQAKRPLTHVVIDRTVCDGPLSESGFIAGAEDGFGIFERWILRLGYFTSRRADRAAFAGDALVLLYPNREVAVDFRQGLVDYVEAGGKVLIVDSPANTDSTANALLHPFDLRIDRSAQLTGRLETPEGWPGGVAAETACEIQGGTPLIRIEARPVAATARLGAGTVTVVGFGSRFTDAKMGVTGNVIPDAALRNVYELEFQLLRTLISDAP
ncbi:MAG: hypothetical protein JSW27_18620 [Phycisphaerales bacterium]|nr:MAG: hypothetical protein JSW27_18620 [Phycisphaerales bacterium]